MKPLVLCFILLMMGCSSLLSYKEIAKTVKFSKIEKSKYWIITPKVLDINDEFIVMWSAQPSLRIDSVFSDSTRIVHYQDMISGDEIEYDRDSYVLPFTIELIKVK